MSVGCRVVPRYSLPEQAISRTRLGNPQAVDLNIRERVRLLLKKKHDHVNSSAPVSSSQEHTFCSAMRFNSLTTACTVAVFPVPGTPEISIYASNEDGAHQPMS